MSGDGDRKRFADVVMPHLGAAYSLAHWLTGNAADAEDVVQEACMRAFRAVGGHSGNARLQARAEFGKRHVLDLGDATFRSHPVANKLQSR